MYVLLENWQKLKYKINMYNNNSFLIIFFIVNVLIINKNDLKVKKKKKQHAALALEKWRNTKIRQSSPFPYVDPLHFLYDDYLYLKFDLPGKLVVFLNMWNYKRHPLSYLKKNMVINLPSNKIYFYFMW